jgi:hypothetical protein
MAQPPSAALLLLAMFVLLTGRLDLAAQELQNVTIPVPGGKIDATLPDEQLKVSRQDLLNWIKAAADAVSQYYGRFPGPHLTLRVRSDGGSSVRHGVTYPKDGGLIVITVGRNADIDELKTDWILPHEMVHLAFPSMERNHRWIEEGISTYVEPVARAQVNQMPVDEVWRQFIHDMPQGEPESGDEGLDNTHTWGRTYWGGAIFCLVADVQIREHTKNRKGLRDALRGILNSGGDITQDWDIEKAFVRGDRATGTSVLQDLYHKMRDKPAPVDLSQLWHKLGLELKDRTVSFDDKAPEANIRLAITSLRSSLSTRKH